MALPTNNNAVNDYKKQGVLLNFNCFLNTINYSHYNFRLLTKRLFIWMK